MHRYSQTTLKNLLDLLSTGTQNLENAIDYMLEVLAKDGLDNVHGEEANVTHWLRNEERARLIEPRDYVIAISSLGSSVGTPKEGILAYAMVVRSFDELKSRSDEVAGKIVIFNQEYEGYPTSAVYRVFSASRAAQYGAVATLIRSITPFSIHRYICIQWNKLRTQWGQASCPL